MRGRLAGSRGFVTFLHLQIVKFVQGIDFRVTKVRDAASGEAERRLKKTLFAII